MNREPRLHTPKSAVLVVGHFPTAVGGFAAAAWKKIDEIYKQNWQANPSKRGNNGRGRRSNEKSDESLSGSEPLLYPIKLDDEGDAGNLRFKQRLYTNFKVHNVWGVISCCTAENSSKLIEALEPIDTPILTALDNTVELAVLSKPNLLQLIPNNALQAQAILSKVGALLPDREEKVTVNAYLWPPQNDFVRDLSKALQNKANEAQNSRINLNQITVGQALREIGSELKAHDVFVYIGYYDGLEKLLDYVKTEKLILSDACAENRVEALMREKQRSYYLSKPSFDPSVYACQGYLSLSKVWLEAWRAKADCTLEQRLQSFIARVRSDMEVRFGSYLFIGATNQSGGYVIRKVQHTTKDKALNHD